MKDLVLNASVRQALRQLTTEELQRGMRAFSHPPRFALAASPEDECGCFVTCVAGYFGADHEEALEAWKPIERRKPDPAPLLSYGYEMGNRDGWFYGECVRELAERGVVVEQELASVA